MPTSPSAPARRAARRRCSEMMGVTVMFSCSGVDKARFLDHVARHLPHVPGLGQELVRRDDGQGGRPLQPLPGRAVRARAPGRDHPGRDAQHRRHLGQAHRCRRGDDAQHDHDGRATTARTCATPRAPRSRGAGRRSSRSRRCAASRPASRTARLRNFGMTLGTRDSRKIVGRYELTARRRARRGALRRLRRHLPGVHRRLRHPRPARPPAATSRCPTGSWSRAR